MKQNTRFQIGLLVVICSLLLAESVRSQSSSGELPSASTFFPPDVFGTVKQGGDIRAKWFACDLIALGEPSLLLEAQSSKEHHTYRFLWLRTFHHPVSVRLTIYSEGEGSIVTRIASGTGGYDAGKVVQDNTVRVRREDVNNVLEQLQEMGFWSMETEESASGEVASNGRSFTQLGADGAQWIVEGVENGEYHVVDRWSPEYPADKMAGRKRSYVQLCRYLLELGKVEVEEKDIY
jgi:hypothetical protein